MKPKTYTRAERNPEQSLLAETNICVRSDPGAARMKVLFANSCVRFVTPAQAGLPFTFPGFPPRWECHKRTKNTSPPTRESASAG